jgi:hypothetical protein
MVELEVYCSRRYDSRYGVFVDHLRHGILEQNDVLVKGIDLALQLDAVDEEIDTGCLTQSVQVRSCSNCPLLAAPRH